jgi:hypothetical protein
MLAGSVGFELEKLVVGKLTLAGQGISFKDLQAAAPDVTSKQMADTIRTLMENRKVVIHQNSCGEKFISLINTLTEGLAVVYDIVRSSGREGIDQMGVCTKAKLSKPEVTKALNQLVAQQKIKDIRCFSNKARKIYMLYDLEPAESVTGGALYNDSRDIDALFVDRLRLKITEFIASRHTVPEGEIIQMLLVDVAAGPLPTKRVSYREARTVLRSLEADGVVQSIPSDGTQLYQLTLSRNISHFGQSNTLGTLLCQYPCVGCPQLDRCSPSGRGPISPKACTYLRMWLAV